MPSKPSVSLREPTEMGKQLPKTMLSDRVKAFVIDAITSGQLKAGDRIVTSSLARRLGVSQAPIREAIRDLVLLGFLETEPYKGPCVRSFSWDELTEVYTVRASLEALGARLAASRLTGADVQELQATLDDMIGAAHNQDRQELVRLDNVFHESIMRISGNKLLLQLWQTLRYGSWTVVTARMLTHDLEMLARRHAKVLAALESRDPEQAMKAMQRHIEELGKPPDDWQADLSLPPSGGTEGGRV
jgi:DNA-binding GntR family transcriptional regulator